MKDTIVFILSELFMVAICLGVVIILFPSMSMQVAFIAAVILYTFSTLTYLLFDFIIKTFRKEFSGRKDLEQ
jgi:hypothetical protein